MGWECCAFRAECSIQHYAKCTMRRNHYFSFKNYCKNMASGQHIITISSLARSRIPSRSAYAWCLLLLRCCTSTRMCHDHQMSAIAAFVAYSVPPIGALPSLMCVIGNFSEHYRAVLCVCKLRFSQFGSSVQRIVKAPLRKFNRPKVDLSNSIRIGHLLNYVLNDHPLLSCAE